MCPIRTGIRWVEFVVWRPVICPGYEKRHEKHPQSRVPALLTSRPLRPGVARACPCSIACRGGHRNGGTAGAPANASTCCASIFSPCWPRSPTRGILWEPVSVRRVAGDPNRGNLIGYMCTMEQTTAQRLTHAPDAQTSSTARFAGILIDKLKAVSPSNTAHSRWARHQLLPVVTTRRAISGTGATSRPSNGLPLTAAFRLLSTSANVFPLSGAGPDSPLPGGNSFGFGLVRIRRVVLDGAGIGSVQALKVPVVGLARHVDGLHSFRLWPACSLAGLITNACHASCRYPSARASSLTCPR
jgi:hypothetical protein